MLNYDKCQLIWLNYYNGNLSHFRQDIHMLSKSGLWDFILYMIEYQPEKMDHIFKRQVLAGIEKNI